MSASEDRLPRGIRHAAAVALVLSGVTGLFSASEVMGLGRLSELKEASRSQAVILGNPELGAKALDAQISALESLRESRALLLVGLCMACAFIFVSSGRMLRPAGLHRENVRRVLGVSTLIAAGLRTIDGAQWAVVARRMGTAMAEAMAHVPEFQAPEAAPMRASIPLILQGGTVLQTFLVASTFLLLGQYFRSERVREAISTQDGPLED